VLIKEFFNAGTRASERQLGTHFALKGISVYKTSRQNSAEYLDYCQYQEKPYAPGHCHLQHF